MKYLLLLRGVNVGGQRKVGMKELKADLEKLGYEEVLTYINSGNVIFVTPKTKDQLRAELRKYFEQNYDFELGFVLLSKEEYLADIVKLPDWWHQPMARRDGLFWMSDDPVNIIEKIQTYPLTSEKVHFGQRAIYWGKEDEAKFLKTAYHRLLIKEPFYKILTIRNGNTIEKLKDLLEK